MCCSVNSWAFPWMVCSVMNCNRSLSRVLFWKGGLETIRCTSCQRLSSWRSAIIVSCGTDCCGDDIVYRFPVWVRLKKQILSLFAMQTQLIHFAVMCLHAFEMDLTISRK